MGVRRLMPIECLRLQGFPDDLFDDLGLADSVKYKMIGNTMCVNVMEWIGRRIQDFWEKYQSTVDQEDRT